MLSDANSQRVEGYRDEERAIAEGFFEAAYSELLNVARQKRRRAGFQDTMMTEDVLQECFVKLTGRSVWASQEHFFRCAALAIRQVVVDHARQRLTQKRGGGVRDVALDEVEDALATYSETPEQLVIIDDLLRQMEAEHPRWVRIVDARYFSGMSEAETAAVLGLSERTVRRDWKAARDWLETQILS